MAKPKQGVESLMKYIPIGVMAVSLISGYTLLQAKVTDASNRLDKMDLVQNKLSEDSGEIRVSQAKVEAKMDSIYEAIKDLKK